MPCSNYISNWGITGHDQPTAFCLNKAILQTNSIYSCYVLYESVYLDFRFFDSQSKGQIFKC